jgi:hypothetical protein
VASHPNLSVPQAAFVTGEFDGGPALVLAHTYYPAAITLEQAHLKANPGAHHHVQ